MTEAEAKLRWCPFARSRHVGGDCGRDHGGSQVGAFLNEGRLIVTCVATACMAWRWSYPPDEAMGNKNGPRGYCGLAGKP